MNYLHKKYLFLSLVSICFFVKEVRSSQSIIFAGINDSAVQVSTFLCDSNDAQTAYDCSQTEVLGAVGHDMSGGVTLQFFNNFVYWMRKKQEKIQYWQTIGYSTTDEIQQHEQKTGWASMGSYCVVVSTDPVMQQAVWPTLSVKQGQTKVVVQLWYNGGESLQLWSQDAVYVDPGSTIGVLVTDQADENLATTLALPNSSSALLGFLEQIGLQPTISKTDSAGIGSRQNFDYNNAFTSPRQVRIIVK